jgi:hypothetical protein
MLIDAGLWFIVHGSGFVCILLINSFSLPSRFVYHQRIRSSLQPLAFRLLSRIVFNRTNVMPSDSRVAAFGEYLMQGDEPADRAAKDLFAAGQNHGRNFKLMRSILEGETKGINDLPASFTELINNIRQDPVWLDRQRLENGARVCRRLGVNAMSVLGDLALLGGYANPDISKPLVFTGQLQGENTFDRLAETSQFWYDVTRPLSMEIGAKGFNSAIRVRMMHAIVRQRLLAHPDWDSESWGWPINKADSLSTNVGFSMAMIYGVRMLGFHLTNREIEDILHLWRYIGYLMGDDPDWLPKTLEEGLQCLALVHFSNKNDPDTGSLALARDYLKTFEPGETDMEWRERLLRHFVHWRHKAYAEYLIPPELHRKLQLPSSGLTWLLVPLLQGPVIFLAERLRLIIPAGESWMEKEGCRQQDRIMEQLMGDREAAYVPKREMAR